MALDPFTALLIASAVSGGVGALAGGGGGGQERRPFTGPNVDPEELLGSLTGSLTDLKGSLVNRANEGVQLRSPTVAQTPGSIRGGSLPFEIGLSGQDPAAFDPSLLSRPGLDIPTMPDATPSLVDTPETIAENEAMQDAIKALQGEENADELISELDFDDLDFEFEEEPFAAVDKRRRQLGG